MTIKNKKIAKRACAVMLSAVMALGTVTPVTNVDAAAKNKGKVTSVSVSNVDGTTLVLKKKKTFKLKAAVEGTGKYSKLVTYKTNKKKIVKVTKKGKLTAVKKGKAKITITSVGNKKVKAAVNVIVGTPVTNITLDRNALSGKAGESVKLTATIAPANASVKDIQFASADENIASVDAEGNVTLKAVGTVKITATAMDGHGKKAECTVTVEAADKKDEQTPTAPATHVTPSDDKKDDNKTDDKKDDSKADDKKDDTKSDNKKDDTKSDDKKDEDKKDEDKKDEDKKDDDVQKDLSYDGYTLKWEDEFLGTELDKDNWNVETHEPGWVNKELQAYVDSTDNIYVNDGNLYIVPIETVIDGKKSYTSGRINTKGKQDYTYGLFEARVKVPAGQGFLPAFWMMPTDEDNYGQWPRCGEIDCMEVMGQTNNKVYGTIHYGNPHSESQGTYTLEEGNFTDEYHLFSCEWEPGKITWYVDGIKYHEESDWYSTTEGKGTVSYPAPFDQQFYMILNLAVGGSWVTNPDETTKYGQQSAYIIDYVKAYQKENYDENVKKPVKEVVLRDPVANDNYINNGDFSVKESLDDDVDWKFMTANEGEAAAEIGENEIVISTTAAGTDDYSVQLVQAGVPFEKGAEYTLSYDAYAGTARTMNVDIKAPDHGYSKYMPTQTAELTTTKKSFETTFTMKADSDANGRLEFNMGAAGSTADIHISNVVIKKTKAADPDAKEVKEVLSDGNYVYNGEFREGEGRMGYWEIVKKAGIDSTVSVVKNGTDTKLRVITGESEPADIKVGETELALIPETEYALSFDASAEAAKTIEVYVAGIEQTAELGKTSKHYAYTFTTPKTLTDKDIWFYLGGEGTSYIDNVRVEENRLIKNGSFDAGKVGFSEYIDGGAVAASVIDSINEENAYDITIKNTGNKVVKDGVESYPDYFIQLIQDGINLESGKWYKLTLKAKSEIDRDIMVAVQHNGTNDDDWTPYSQKTMSLNKASYDNGDYQNYEVVFQMTKDDPKARFSVTMGSVGGKQITEQHRICIDDIELAETAAPEETPDTETENILKNPSFAESGDGWIYYGADNITLAEGVATFPITDVGDDDSKVALLQNDITLEKGQEYILTFKASSTADRTINVCLQKQTNPYTWAGGDGKLSLTSSLKEYTIRFTPDAQLFADEATSTEDNRLSFAMGKITEWTSEGKVTSDTEGSTIVIKDISLVKVVKAASQDGNLLTNPGFEGSTVGTDWAINPGESNPAVSFSEGAVTYTIINIGTVAYSIQLGQDGLSLAAGQYKVSFNIKSSVDRHVVYQVSKSNYDWFGTSGGTLELAAGNNEPVELTFSVDEAATDAHFQINLGKIEGDGELGNHTITISDLKLVKVTE